MRRIGIYVSCLLVVSVVTLGGCGGGTNEIVETPKNLPPPGPPADVKNMEKDMVKQKAAGAKDPNKP